jgi:chromosome segregation ATPase
MRQNSTQSSRALRKLDDVKRRLDNACLAFGPLFAERNEAVNIARARAKELHVRATELSTTVTNREREIAELTRFLAERETSNGELEARTAELSATVTSRELEITELTRSLAEREASNGELEARTAELSATVTSRELEIAELTRSLTKHQTTNAKLEQKIAELKIEIRTLEGSRSWLVTAPFRRLAGAAKLGWRLIRYSSPEKRLV